jgi:hypothetical protein
MTVDYKGHAVEDEPVEVDTGPRPYQVRSANGATQLVTARELTDYIREVRAGSGPMFGKPRGGHGLKGVLAQPSGVA